MPKQKSLIGFLVLFGEISYPNHAKLSQIFYEKRRSSIDATFDEKVEPDTYLKLEDLDEEVHRRIQMALSPDEIHGVVCFECLDMCSSHYGERKALIFGPNCTYKTLDQVMWRGEERSYAGSRPVVVRKIPNIMDAELASTQKFPVAFYVKPGVEVSP